MDALETNVTGGFFIAAAAMLWLGWTFLPAKIGDYFEVSDFAAVGAHRRIWIWLFRLHLFGYVFSVMAFVAVATLLAGATARIVIWPAVAVLNTGLIMGALAGAFYYHFGAWGALDMEGKSNADIEQFIASIRASNEYVTCVVRFGRVFVGVGQIALVIGLLLSDGPWPNWLLVPGAALGLAGIALTMGLPDELKLYRPVFHLNVIWLAAFGTVTLL